MAADETAVARELVVELDQLGVFQEVNRLILHPLGFAMGLDALGEFVVIDTRDAEAESAHFPEEILNADKATTVAEMIEARGPDRLERLGYVVQPLPPEVKQLKVSVLEPTTTYIGAPDELDEGEELELTMEPGGES